MSNVIQHPGSRPFFDGEEPSRPRAFNVEAEQALLGALLLENGVFDLVSSVVEARHFYDPVHARIFEAIEKRIGLGLTASAVTIKGVMARDEGLEALGGPEYLAAMAGAAVSIVAAPDYAETIRNMWIRRQRADILDQAMEGLWDASDPDEVMAEMESQLLDVDEAPSVRSAGCTMAHALNTAVERMNQAYSGAEVPGVSLGIPELEKIIGKAQPGDYILLGGRPSMGKSAVAGEIARRIAKAGTAVVYWCHEMAPEDNAERILSAEVRERGLAVAYRDARAGRMSEDEFRSILEAGRDMESLPIHYVESSFRDITRVCHEMRSKARRFQRQGRDVVLVVDYLQQLTGPGRSRYEIVSDASAALKALAMEVRCPILVLSQLSRQVEHRDVKRPSLADLRDSGQIEQDANTVLFIYRDEYYLERDIQADPDADDVEVMRVALDRARGKLEIIVAKQRSGPLRTAVVRFDGATNSIHSSDSQSRDQREFGI